MPRPAWPVTGSAAYVAQTAAAITDLQTTADEDALVHRVTKFVAGSRYGGETVIGGQLQTSFLTANYILAMPFATGPDGILANAISINVTTAVAGNARLGIYQSSAAAPYLPTSLLADFGTVLTGTTGTKSIAFTAVRYTGAVPSHLIWLAVLANAGPTVKGYTQVSTHLGVANDDTLRCGVNMPQTYGVLPASFSPTIDSQTPQVVLTAG